MRLGRVIGNVWATCKSPRLQGHRMLILVPITREGRDAGEPLVALDTMDAGPRDVVMYATSSEAALPFRPGLTPTDATVVGIVERVDSSDQTWSTA